ncbi:MAG: methyltransferase, partial [bacterium]
MYTEIFPLDKKYRDQLSHYLCSQTVQEHLPEEFASSAFWDVLRNTTYVAVSHQGAVVHSGHNFMRPPQYQKIRNFLARCLKIKLISKVVEKINTITHDLLLRHNHLQKLASARNFRFLSECSYAGKYQCLTASLEKALPYNSIAVHGAAENISYIIHTVEGCFPIQKKFIFFELGAGAGNTTLALLDKYPSSRAIICDLPETIAAAYTFISYFSEKSLKMVLP